MAGLLDGLFSEGKYGKEFHDLKKKIAREPKNFYLLVKMGDLLGRMGKRAEALEAYGRASDKISLNGFLVQAIAVNKVILRLDPSRSNIHAQLAELYAKREMVAEEKIEHQMGEPARKEVVSSLPLIPLFSDLKKDELARVMEKIQSKPFPQGSVICQEGEPGDSIFIISHGKVGVFRRNVSGEKISVSDLKEGDFFGEFGFFSNSRRQATVEALEEAEILEITKKDMEEIIREFPSISEVLLQFYKERVLDTLLATSELFRSFPPQERKQILGKLQMEEFPVGATVLEEGAPGDSLYIIKKGRVEVFTLDLKGDPLPLARLQEGDFFGEISLLTGRPRTASVKVLQSAELLRLAKDDFDHIISNHPEIRQILEESLHLRLGEKMKALGVFRESPAKEGLV
ncbi:MAG: cyclic nucleotide-binding domain-containing protein [Thermodesulfobacteriota bacterium]|nr:cyclic nucleotide-binding domain-containing protein [Thermodesulfobacteriota bacterium]